MTMTPRQARQLRRACFAKKLPLNPSLLDAAGDAPGHAFLTNPASHNIYLYLTEYVKAFTERWFDRPIGELRLLDWGCGKGLVTLLLRQRGARMTACDLVEPDGGSNPEMHAVIVERIGADVIPLEHDYRLPFGDGEFHAVLSFGVLEHVPDDAESMREIRRVLAGGGLMFCFYLPYFLSWTQRLTRMRGDLYHERLYGKRRVRALAAGADMTIVDIWHRQLFPKISIRYPKYRWFEAADRFLATYTPLKYLATNIEFVARKD